MALNVVLPDSTIVKIESSGSCSPGNDSFARIVTNDNNTMAYTVIKHPVRMSSALVPSFVHNYILADDELSANIAEYVTNRIKNS